MLRDARRPNVAALSIRVAAVVLFVVATMAAFVLFYGGLAFRDEVAASGTDTVYWVFSGLVVPLGVLGAGVVAMLHWSDLAPGRVRWAGIGCAALCLVGVVGVLATGLSPVLDYAAGVLIGLAVTVLGVVLHLAAETRHTRPSPED